MRLIDVNPRLAYEIRFYDGYGVKVTWHVSTDGQSAIGIGEGFLWSIEIDADGTVATHEVNPVVLEWSTGISL